MTNKKMKITFIGTGAMATAMAKVLHDGGYKNLVMYGIDETEREELSRGINTKYFNNSVDLPNFETTADLEYAMEDTSYVVIAVPSKAMGFVMSDLLKNINSDIVIVNLSKGFYPTTKESLHEGISRETKGIKDIRGVVSIIGPSHAEEIVLKAPTAVAVVGTDKKIILEVQKMFYNEYFKTYMQTDVRGAEVGAAYKNVLAIASGLSNGLGYGINTTAALLTRGISEMSKFNKTMKGKQSTLRGLTGFGDLIVTAMSPLSRNFTFGKELAADSKKALKTTATVEGLVALDVIYEIGKEKKLELPIVELLYKVIKKNESPDKLIKELWNRDLKPE